jgi:hypothetical protein
MQSINHISLTWSKLTIILKPIKTIEKIIIVIFKPKKNSVISVLIMIFFLLFIILLLRLDFCTFLKDFIWHLVTRSKFAFFKGSKVLQNSSQDRKRKIFSILWKKLLRFLFQKIKSYLRLIFTLKYSQSCEII